MGKWKDAAIEALRIAGRPLTVPEILEIIEDEGLLEIFGGMPRTPEQTLRNEIRRYCSGVAHVNPGKKYDYFCQPERGKYGLIGWEDSESASHTQDSTPVTQPSEVKQEGNIIPEEIGQPEEYVEGATTTISVTVHERDLKAREACINHYGARCIVCRFSFEEKYGALGAGYIHVHHVRPLSEIDEEYQIDPIDDLRPVCANCHAMLHKTKPPLSTEDLKAIIESAESK